VAEQRGKRRVQREVYLHRGRDGGPRESREQLTEIHRRRGAFGQPAELGELPGELLQPPDSDTSTSMASCWFGLAPRESWATASRIGVNGFRISWATRRAVSRKARSRSASMARERPCSRASAISRSAVRSAWNSGAPRRGRSGGSASRRRM
jgi:hypothetical protein